jgi:hypothetical protein
MYTCEYTAVEPMNYPLEACPSDWEAHCDDGKDNMFRNHGEKTERKRTCLKKQNVIFIGVLQER